MKQCSTCRLELEFTSFYLDPRRSDGLYSRCKQCHWLTMKRYRKTPAGKAKTKETNDRFMKTDKGKALRYRYAKTDKSKRRIKRYRDRNPELLYFHQRKRYIAELNATPPWLSVEDKIKIKEIYHQAEVKSLEEGIKYHVDHIIPLQGTMVSGLHVPWNLRIIPAHENQKKYNKLGN